MRTNFVYHFVDSELKTEISAKKKGQQKKGALKQRIEAPLHTFPEVSRKFHAEPVCFFKIFFCDKKNSFLNLYFISFYFFSSITVFERKYPFLEIFTKNQNFLLKLKFRTQINSNMLNSMVIFTFLKSEIPLLC